MSSYDEWKTTEPHDPWADEQERIEREAEQDREEHPERYADAICEHCSTLLTYDEPHVCQPRPLYNCLTCGQGFTGPTAVDAWIAHTVPSCRKERATPAPTIEDARWDLASEIADAVFAEMRESGWIDESNGLPSQSNMEAIIDVIVPLLRGFSERS